MIRFDPYILVGQEWTTHTDHTHARLIFRPEPRVGPNLYLHVVQHENGEWKLDRDDTEMANINGSLEWLSEFWTNIGLVVELESHPLLDGRPTNTSPYEPGGYL